MEEILHALITSTLDGGWKSAPNSNRYTFRERSPDTILKLSTKIKGDYLTSRIGPGN